MIVREAASTDYGAMSALCEQVDALHAEARPDVFCDPPTPGRSVAYFDSRREEQGAAAFVAELDGLVVGCAIVRLNVIPDIPILRAGRFAYLEELVVAQQYRRRGVGEALMRRSKTGRAIGKSRASSSPHGNSIGAQSNSIKPLALRRTTVEWVGT